MEKKRSENLTMYGNKSYRQRGRGRFLWTTQRANKSNQHYPLNGTEKKKRKSVLSSGGREQEENRRIYYYFWGTPSTGRKRRNKLKRGRGKEKNLKKRGTGGFLSHFSRKKKNIRLRGGGGSGY